MAVKRWVGKAAARVDVWTITLAGTFASGDTVTVSVGKKDLIVTLGPSASTVLADIATEVAEAINATTYTPATGFTWSAPGKSYLEFAEFSASANSAVITITGTTVGVPIGVVASDTAAAGSATAANPAATKATGPNFLDNPDNYLGGVLPVDNDDLFFDQGATDVKYALDYFRTNAIDLNYYVTGDYAGNIGNTPENVNGYAEYRLCYLQVRGGSKQLQVLPGLTTANGAGSLRFDFTDQNTAITISAQRGVGPAPTVFLAGGHASNANGDTTIAAGFVAVEPDEAGSAAPMRLVNLAVGTPTATGDTCRVTVGTNATWHATPSVVVDGGVLRLNSGAADAAIVVNSGATLYLAEDASAASIEISAGASVLPIGAANTLGDVACRGTLDYRQCPAGSTSTSTGLRLYAGASLYAPNGNELAADLVGCTIQQLQAFVIPANRQLSWATPADPT